MDLKDVDASPRMWCELRCCFATLIQLCACCVYARLVVFISFIVRPPCHPSFRTHLPIPALSSCRDGPVIFMHAVVHLQVSDRTGWNPERVCMQQQVLACMYQVRRAPPNER